MPSLYPYQSELLDTLSKMDMSELEEKIRHNTKRYNKSEAQKHFMQLYFDTPNKITTRYNSDGSLREYKIHSNNIDMVYFDEAQQIKEFDWPDRYPMSDEPKEKDWARTRFQQDTLSSTPSAAKRAKLRAKRKRRK